MTIRDFDPQGFTNVVRAESGLHNMQAGLYVDNLTLPRSQLTDLDTVNGQLDPSRPADPSSMTMKD